MEADRGNHGSNTSETNQTPSCQRQQTRVIPINTIDLAVNAQYELAYCRRCSHGFGVTVLVCSLYLPLTSTRTLWSHGAVSAVSCGRLLPKGRLTVNNPVYGGENRWGMLLAIFSPR